MARRRKLEPARGGPARFIALRSADGAALANRQHRHSPRAPSLQSYSLLSLTAGAARLSRAQPNRPAHLVREPAVRALALWDEGQHRLVSFRDARASRGASGWVEMQSDSEIGERAVNCGALWTGPKFSGFHFP